MFYLYLHFVRNQGFFVCVLGVNNFELKKQGVSGLHIDLLLRHFLSAVTNLHLQNILKSTFKREM